MLQARFFLGILFAIFTLNTSLYGKENPKIYLLRAPRSGSHWFFYCSHFLFHKNIHIEDATPLYHHHYYNSSNEEKIISAHNPYDLCLDRESPHRDLLILLVRNYRECLLRNYENAKNVKEEILYQASLNHLSDNREWVLHLRKNHFFHNLRVYDMWNREKRLIVYYEDLLQAPEKTLLEIAAFIGATNKEQEVKDFVDYLEEHMEKSLETYANMGYKSQTRGQSFLYHTYRIGMEKSREIDQLVLRYFPHFTEKYLTRYLLDLKKISK